jgi:hypothetical protein
MGASEALAAKLKQTINEEAEVLMAEKRTAAGAVNIKTNEERMKVGGRGRVDGWGRAEGRACCSCLAPRARQEPCPSWQRGGEGSARDGRAHRKGGACNSATTACRLPSISGSHHASPHAACACSQEVAAFWVPGKGPEAKALLDKPDMSTLCPASGDKLKLKVWPAAGGWRPVGGVGGWGGMGGGTAVLARGLLAAGGSLRQRALASAQHPAILDF